MNYETRTVKVIFFIITICLLVIAVYVINKENKPLAVNVATNSKEEISADTILIGCVNIDTLNPLTTKSKDCQYILKLVYEPLIDINNNFELQGNLAIEWTKLDSKIYLIKLNKDKLWQDGKTFTAQDVAFTINFLQSKVDSIYKENVANIDKVSVIDDDTIKIYLKEETDFFEYKLIFPIIAKHQFDDKFNMLEKTPVGTGKYVFKEINDNCLKLYNKDAKTKELKILKYDEISNIYSDFEKEKIDVFISSNIDFEKHLGTIGYKSKLINDRNFDYIKINKDNQILKSKNIRQAINYAINRKEIIYSVYNNKYQETTFPINKLKNNENEFNIIKSQKLILEDGWSYKNKSWSKQGRKLLLRLAVNSELQDRVKVAEIIKKQLETIGINIEIVELNEREYKIALKNNNYDLILTGTIISIEPNYRSYLKDENEIEGTLLQEISQIEDKEKRQEKITELIKYCNDNIPFISLYFNPTVLLLNSNLKGDFDSNWFNIFYDIKTWYKVYEK